jgi:hypothetical protein
MSEQFHFPFMDSPEKQLDLHLPKEETGAPEPDLESLDRKDLEELYFAKIGRHRFMGRTDEEVRAAILDPEGEIARLREIDRVDDAWKDLGPTGK